MTRGGMDVFRLDDVHVIRARAPALPEGGELVKFLSACLDLIDEIGVKRTRCVALVDTPMGMAAHSMSAMNHDVLPTRLPDMTLMCRWRWDLDDDCKDDDEFVSVGCRTHYSFQNGFGSPMEWASRAAKIGAPVLSVADTTMAGAIGVMEACKKTGVESMVGLRIPIRLDGDRSMHAGNVIAFARGGSGFVEICRLATTLAMGKMVSPKDLNHDLVEVVIPSIDGVLYPHYMHSGVGRKMEALCKALGRTPWVGIPIHSMIDHKRDPRTDVSFIYRKNVVPIAEEMGIPLYADVAPLFPRREEAASYGAWISMSKTIPFHKRMWGIDQFLMTRGQAVDLARRAGCDVKDGWLDAGGEIADRCRGASDALNDIDHLPRWRTSERYDPSEVIGDAAPKLREIVTERWGAYKRERGIEDEGLRQSYVQRIRDEFRVIESRGFSDYFMIVADICDHARKIGVPMAPNRGSVGGSLVAFLLGIIEIDPIIWGTLFERFLNPDRKGYPDIDLDFASEVGGGRDAVRKYVIEKYGRECVAYVGAVRTIQLPNAMGAAYRMFLGKDGRREREMVTKALNGNFKKAVLGKRAADSFTVEDLDRFIEADTPGDGDAESSKGLVAGGAFKRFLDDHHPYARESIEAIMGQVDGHTTHAGGIVILPYPFTETPIPLASYGEGDKREVVTAYDKDDLERMGAVKFDLLAVQTLDFLHNALAKVENATGERPTWDDVSLDEESMYDLFKAGLTAGIFQFNSAGLTKYLKDLRPTRLMDLVFASAAYRPGPMQAGFHKDAIDVRSGRKKIEEVVVHKSLLPLVKDTYGVIVYQEQIINAAKEIGGLTPGEADSFRRAVSKKKREDILQFKDKFMSNARTRHGMTEDEVSKLFQDMEGFAEYCFNYSHSLGYAMTGARCAWIKANHPGAYFEALMETSKVAMGELAMAFEKEFPAFGLSVAHPTLARPTYSRAMTTNGVMHLPLWRVFGISEHACAAMDDHADVLSGMASPGDFVNYVLDLRSMVRKRRSTSPWDEEKTVENPFNLAVVTALVRCGAFHHLVGCEMSFESEESLGAMNDLIDQVGAGLKISISKISNGSALSALESELYGSSRPFTLAASGARAAFLHDRMDEYVRGQLVKGRKLDDGSLVLDRGGRTRVRIVAYVTRMKVKGSNTRKYAFVSLSASAFDLDVVAFASAFQAFDDVEHAKRRMVGQVVIVDLEWSSSYERWGISDVVKVVKGIAK